MDLFFTYPFVYSCCIVEYLYLKFIKGCVHLLVFLYLLKFKALFNLGIKKIIIFFYELVKAEILPFLIYILRKVKFLLVSMWHNFWSWYIYILVHNLCNLDIMKSVVQSLYYKYISLFSLSLSREINLNLNFDILVIHYDLLKYLKILYLIRIN
jgi:hypothetical protein